MLRSVHTANLSPIHSHTWTHLLAWQICLSVCLCVVESWGIVYLIFIFFFCFIFAWNFISFYITKSTLTCRVIYSVVSCVSIQYATNTCNARRSRWQRTYDLVWPYDAMHNARYFVPLFSSRVSLLVLVFLLLLRLRLLPVVCSVVCCVVVLVTFSCFVLFSTCTRCECMRSSYDVCFLYLCCCECVSECVVLNRDFLSKSNQKHLLCLRSTKSMTHHWLLLWFVHFMCAHKPWTAVCTVYTLHHCRTTVADGTVWYAYTHSTLVAVFVHIQVFQSIFIVDCFVLVFMFASIFASPDYVRRNIKRRLSFCFCLSFICWIGIVTTNIIRSCIE